jgi:hypothetical protein
LDYKLPTTLDTPDIETILIEQPDREGPYGGKEAGQGPLNPVIPAIANAVYNAIGLRIDEVPITPDKVLKALKAATNPSRGPLRPQIPPINFTAPWPTRLVSWSPPTSTPATPFDSSPAHVGRSAPLPLGGEDNPSFHDGKDVL